MVHDVRLELSEAINELGLPEPKELQPFYAKWDGYAIEGMATEPMEWHSQKLNEYGAVDCYCVRYSTKAAACAVKAWMDEAALLKQIEAAGLPGYCRFDEPQFNTELIARWTALEFEIRKVETENGFQFGCHKTVPFEWSTRHANTLEEALQTIREMMEGVE